NLVSKPRKKEFIKTINKDSCNFNQVQDIKWILEDKTYLKDFISAHKVTLLRELKLKRYWYFKIKVEVENFGTNALMILNWKILFSPEEKQTMNTPKMYQVKMQKA
ncbi:uncharacterized protein LOC132736511, partial [Ruditapes philippinarum]|uniref:uncharacterized protein LOC132736511 n=1 Tax=Ruditapes philippinarum TaxID=129788 RepID=UPI00295A96B3